jgi:inner membrane protein
MRSSAIARLVVMGILTVGLLVPLTMVYSVVSERASRRNDAVAEVSQTWGGQQTVSGPVLSVPYAFVWTDNWGKPQRAAGHAHFLPRDLAIAGHLNTELRRRGIFDVVVYRSELKVTGRFVRADLDWVRPAPDRIDWHDARISVGISDPRGLRRRAALSWAGREEPFSGGVADVGLFRAGIHARVTNLEAFTPGAEIPFSFTLDLNGTRDLRFLPGAEETMVSLTSAWPHPSFAGAPLPDSRTVQAEGFRADWRVPDFGRPYSARWLSADMDREQLQGHAERAAFGVGLLQPVDIYQQAERAVKYAVLFIVLTFLVFFLWEIFHTALLHPVQYVFVGFALCVFYLLLVSLSEHTGFDRAYAASAVVTTLLVGGYARAILRGRRQGASVAMALSAAYVFLYLLLRLEDYALLAGSVGLFVVLALVMYVTRRMDWYELRLGSHHS